MKNIIALFALFCLFATSQLTAQHLGLRVGVNATDAKIDFDNQEVTTDGETNLMLGLFLNLPIGTNLISVQPELNYLNRGYSTSVNIGNVVSFDRTLAFVDLGALIRLNFGSDEALGFYLGAGPYFSYAISGTVTDINGERDVNFDSDRLKRGDLQVAGVGGVTFGKSLRFLVEGRYMGSIGNQSDQDGVNIKQNSIGVNGGIMIPIGG